MIHRQELCPVVADGSRAVRAHKESHGRATDYGNGG